MNYFGILLLGLAVTNREVSMDKNGGWVSFLFCRWLNKRLGTVAITEMNYKVSRIDSRSHHTVFASRRLELLTKKATLSRTVQLSQNQN